MSEDVKPATDDERTRLLETGGLSIQPTIYAIAKLDARINAEMRARKAAERELELERDLCAVCGVESCRHAGAGHAFATRRQRIVDLERLLAEQRSRADVAEQEIEDEMQRRDRYHDAVTEAHVALGGDGEWRAHVGGSPEPPHSGCLNLDVPVMARQLRERIAALEAELASRQGGNAAAWSELRREKETLEAKLADAHRRLAENDEILQGKHTLYEQVKNTLEQVEDQWCAAETRVRELKTLLRDATRCDQDGVTAIERRLAAADRLAEAAENLRGCNHITFAQGLVLDEALRAYEESGNT